MAGDVPERAVGLARDGTRAFWIKISGAKVRRLSVSTTGGRENEAGIGSWHPPPYAARNATKSKGTASLKVDSDPLGSQIPQ